MTASVTNRKILLAGNGAAACASLDLALSLRPPADVLVLAPSGGPLHAWQDSLEAAAARRGVRCLTPERVNEPDVVAEIAAFGADLLLSVYYTQIFRPALLEAVNGPRLNVHPSLLPRHRGTAPLIWAIVEGDTRTGVTVHHLDTSVDTGRIVIQRELSIHDEDTGSTLHDKATRLAVATVADLLRRWSYGEPIPEGYAQEGPGCLHRKADATLNLIDPQDSPERVARIVRALAPPLPGATIALPGGLLTLCRVTPVEISGPAGTLTWTADGPVYLLASGGVRLDRIWAGGRELTGERLPAAGLEPVNA
jgi:methionyl-tRNA formyltransferase